MKNELLRSDMENIVMHDYLIALIGYGFGDVIYHENPLMLYRSHSSSVTIKEKISLKHRIESFINRVSSKEYLKPNINQIEEILDIYGSKLTLDKLNLSKEFGNSGEIDKAYKVFETTSEKTKKMYSDYLEEQGTIRVRGQGLKTISKISKNVKKELD